MTYEEGRAGLQLIAEMGVGAPMRANTAQENAAEDATIAALKRAR